MFFFYVLSFFKKGDTIQGGTLFKGGYYLRKYGIHITMEMAFLFSCPNSLAIRTENPVLVYPNLETFLSRMPFNTNGWKNSNFYNFFLEVQNNPYKFINLRQLYNRITWSRKVQSVLKEQVCFFFHGEIIAKLALKNIVTIVCMNLEKKSF